MHLPTRSAPTRCLILGGTSEASALARLLAGDDRFAPLLSFAGRTRNPEQPPIPCRIGGFGGAEGLAEALHTQNMHALIDATHPFAVRISANAAAAAARLSLPFLTVLRPAWTPVAGDRWEMANTLHDAALILGTETKRVFLTIGRQELAPFHAAPWHHYVIRSVDPPEDDSMPPQATIISARGPFAEAEERALLQAHQIDCIVTKNAGGTATYAKLAAARALQLPVIMVRRPECITGGQTTAEPSNALRWLAALHHGRDTPRGA